MKTKDIFIQCIAGTTFMTVFSYLVSVADWENSTELGHYAVDCYLH